jgi:putative MATE family efflux protein
MDKKIESSGSWGIVKSIMILSTPLLMENLLQVTMGLADNFFVSKLGPEYIAGVGITNLIINIYMAVFFAIGVSTTALVSRYIGAKDKMNASKTAQQALLLSVLIGIVVGLLNILFSKQILSILGLDQDLMNAASPYFLSVAGPIVFLSISMMLSSAFRAAKNTKITMKVSIITNIINILLDPILIFGVAGIPGMGVVGAGIATSVSRLVSVLLMIYYTRKIWDTVEIKFPQKAKFDTKIMKNLIRLGLPVATERLFMRIGQIIYSAFIIGLGTQIYAAYIITATLDSYAYIPGMAIGGAAASLVGNSLGSGNKDEAFKYGLGSLLVGTIFMILIGITNFTLAPLIGRAFSDNQIVIDNIVYILRLMVLIEPVSAISLIITPVLQGAGDTKYPMVFTLIGIWLFRVVGIYVLVEKLDYGIFGVLLMIFLDLLVRSVLLMRRFFKREWQSINIY